MSSSDKGPKSTGITRSHRAPVCPLKGIPTDAEAHSSGALLYSSIRCQGPSETRQVEVAGKQRVVCHVMLGGNSLTIDKLQMVLRGYPPCAHTCMHVKVFQVQFENLQSYTLTVTHSETREGLCSEWKKRLDVPDLSLVECKQKRRKA